MAPLRKEAHDTAMKSEAESEQSQDHIPEIFNSKVHMKQEVLPGTSLEDENWDAKPHVPTGHPRVPLAEQGIAFQAALQRSPGPSPGIRGGQVKKRRMNEEQLGGLSAAAREAKYAAQRKKQKKLEKKERKKEKAKIAKKRSKQSQRLAQRPEELPGVQELQERQVELQARLEAKLQALGGSEDLKGRGPVEALRGGLGGIAGRLGGLNLSQGPQIMAQKALEELGGLLASMQSALEGLESVQDLQELRGLQSLPGLKIQRGPQGEQTNHWG
ncbi:MAG: hypothetical protein Q9218_005727 [Villophora microphyllina]